MLKIAKTKFWSENLKGRDIWLDLGVDGKFVWDLTLRKYGGKMSTGFIWLRVDYNGRLWLISNGYQGIFPWL